MKLTFEEKEIILKHRKKLAKRAATLEYRQRFWDRRESLELNKIKILTCIINGESYATAAANNSARITDIGGALFFSMRDLEKHFPPLCDSGEFAANYDNGRLASWRKNKEFWLDLIAKYTAAKDQLPAKLGMEDPITAIDFPKKL